MIYKKLLPLLLTLLLGACTGSPAPAPTESESLTETPTETPAETPTETPTEAPVETTSQTEERVLITDSFGCTIDAASLGYDITVSGDDYIFTDYFGNEVVLSDKYREEGNKIDFYYDFVYLTISDGTLYDSRVSPQAFTDDARKNQPEKTFFRAEAGDSFEGLTLTEASSRYWLQENSPVYSWARFDGKLTLKGYACIDLDYQSGYIYFVPLDGEWEGLPMAWRNPEAFHYGIQVGGEEFEVTGNLPILCLGEADEYEIDLSPIPTDGTYAIVQVTLTDIVLRGVDGDLGGSSNFARITEITAV